MFRKINCIITESQKTFNLKSCHLPLTTNDILTHRLYYNNLKFANLPLEFYIIFATFSIFLKNKKLRCNVIDHNDDDICDKLHNSIVEVKLCDKNIHQDNIKHS